MFEWNYIFRDCGRNNKLAGTKFEKLAIEYLSDCYPQYRWESTQSSWDNNRDFFSLIIDNIWGEAKYRSHSSALRKQDIDPTMLSGIIDGTIRRIFFITNGYLPKTLIDRLSTAGTISGIDVICITKQQLEYWLILHPAVIKEYLGAQNIPEILPPALSIHSVYFSNQLETEKQTLSTLQKLECNEFYSLNIVFESSIHAKLDCDIDTSMVALIEKPGYDSIHKITISPGIQTKRFLVRTVKPFMNKWILAFSSSCIHPVQYVVDMCIFDAERIELVYSDYQTALTVIYNSLNRLDLKIPNMITILSASSMGKTHLIQTLSKEFYQFHDTICLSFVDEANTKLNDMLLCRLVLFLNFGEFFRYANPQNDQGERYLTILIEQATLLGWPEFIIEALYSGYCDSLAASNSIAALSDEDYQALPLVRQTGTSQCKIAFLDNIHNLNLTQITFFERLVRQNRNLEQSSIFICSATQNYPNSLYGSYDFGDYIFHLSGLSVGDRFESIRSNIPQMDPAFLAALAARMPHCPHEVSVMITLLKYQQSSTIDFDAACSYVSTLEQNLAFYMHVPLDSETQLLLDLLHDFINGLGVDILRRVGFTAHSIEGIVNLGHAYVSNGQVFPRHSYLYSAYCRLRGAKRRSAACAERLIKLLDIVANEDAADTAIAILYACDPTVYAGFLPALYKKQHDAYLKSNHKRAMLYGSILNQKIISGNKQILEEQELESFFYYGVSLIHCDSKRRAIEVFTWIQRHAPKSSLTYFMASAETLNNHISRFDTKDRKPFYLTLSFQLKRIIDSVVDNKDGISLWRIAYSTCQNRIMMLLCLLEEYDEAKTIYESYINYHKRNNLSEASPKYDSMLNEWHMDYARGVTMIHPQKSLELYATCQKCFDERIDARRCILCELDYMILRSCRFNEYPNWENPMRKIIDKLSSKGFIEEQNKALLKLNLCKLVYSIKAYGVEVVQSIANDIQQDLYETQIETTLSVQGRTSYYYFQLLALLHFSTGNIDAAIIYLERILVLVKDVGSSYRNIANHNLAHIRKTTTVTWRFGSGKLDDRIYYIDSRLW